jgi:ribosomal-protein-alanine N-acetyltransferase
MTAIRTCTLRLAKPGDARPLARMSRDYIEQGLAWRWRGDALKKKILAPESVVLVAELDVGGVRFIGGFAVMDFAIDKAQLVLFAVHPNLRRRNIGGQLIRWLHKSARVAGCEHVELQVRAENYPARRFYQKYGYLEEALIPGYYEGKHAAYQMKLRLRED